ncbi:Type I restriction modification DNA specificity domain-containing protein [Thalassobacillus cyri]|uniref:Type I restriction modification DNA specificity domain-containing protein n=1 Tax=Thalassobacillus cyri TaxID=571932 RepID=A0A1H3VXJ9_9BACI|nr:restriction endonuclease subunit S [Thalassobacillus cyri]SDZ79411.1 Type I restriction modification DNA specificity domain-containing protein [Thalassobacillus cyri]
MKNLTHYLSNAVHTEEDVNKLKQYILNLAVRGKLIDNSSSELKHQNTIEGDNEEETLYEIPKSWRWVTLEDILMFKNGYAFKSDTYIKNSNYQVIRLGNVKNDKLLVENKEVYIPKEIALSCKDFRIKDKDILVTMTGTKGKRDYFYTCLFDSKIEEKTNKQFFLNQRVGILRANNSVKPELVNIFLKSKSILDLVFTFETGTANQGNLGTRAIKRIPFPLPPYEEQESIITKVKELFTLCDKLAIDIQYKNKHSTKLNKTIFSEVLGHNNDNMHENLNFIVDNINDLLENKEDISLLRKAILSLGIRGKLSVSNPSDDSASKLLEEMKEEKNRLIKNKSLRVSKLNKEHSVTTDIPENWKKVKIGDLMEPINGKSFKTSEWSNEGVPIIRIQNLNNKHAPFNYYNGETAIPEKYHVSTGDLLIGWSGTPGTSFGAFIWDRGFSYLNQHIFKAKLFSSNLDPVYLKHAINAVLEIMISQARGGVGLKHVTKSQFVNIEVGLPPISEQKQIVHEINKLFLLCNQLEEQLDQQNDLQEKFMNSIIQ